jgi:hypothetical protein
MSQRYPDINSPHFGQQARSTIDNAQDVADSPEFSEFSTQESLP